jgi:aspartyl-tRNA(Asn)/glutamyl-tRNA(Gln) amidotransferase subunit C
MSKQDLTRENILHLAKLANLSLTDAEIEKYQSQIGETLDYVKNLSELDTTNTKETHHTVDLENVQFEDGSENKRSLSQDEATKNAQDAKDNYFVVKRIL